MPDKNFKVLLTAHERKDIPDCPATIPWEMIAPHEERAKKNHGRQSLEKLNSRGGLGPGEMILVLVDEPWTQEFFDGVPERVAAKILIKLVEGFVDKKLLDHAEEVAPGVRQALKAVRALDKKGDIEEEDIEG